MYLGILLLVHKLARLRDSYEVQYTTAVLQQNVLAKYIKTINLKLPTVLLFVEFNTTMALAIVTEQCDFVGAGVGQSCGCGSEITVF
jgi:hypothetical protein